MAGPPRRGSEPGAPRGAVPDPTGARADVGRRSDGWHWARNCSSSHPRLRTLRQFYSGSFKRAVRCWTPFTAQFLWTDGRKGWDGHVPGSFRLHGRLMSQLSRPKEGRRSHDEVLRRTYPSNPAIHMHVAQCVDSCVRRWVGSCACLQSLFLFLVHWDVCTLHDCLPCRCAAELAASQGPIPTEAACTQLSKGFATQEVHRKPRPPSEEKGGKEACRRPRPTCEDCVSTGTPGDAEEADSI